MYEYVYVQRAVICRGNLLPIHINTVPVINERLIKAFDHIFTTERTIGRQNVLHFIFDFVTSRQIVCRIRSYAIWQSNGNTSIRIDVSVSLAVEYLTCFQFYEEPREPFE